VQGKLLVEASGKAGKAPGVFGRLRRLPQFFPKQELPINKLQGALRIVG
jgi:hypothetical protein